MNKTAKEKLYKVLEEVLGLKITDDLSIDDVPRWDSLLHLQLLARIDEAFGIDIDFEDTLTMTNVKSIKKVVGKYVKSK